ncbi:MAG: hypothetical protein OXE81_10840 [Gammaproteobacteria bacterium]|nr:hypothetical protein [Gammaproteobacteria bacterium]MCY4278312.1 hypothetical protein [Gammaproteobacteria bacterium]
MRKNFSRTAFVVQAGQDRCPVSQNVEAISLLEMVELLVDGV